MKRRLSSSSDTDGSSLQKQDSVENDVSVLRQNSETESHNGSEDCPTIPESPVDKLQPEQKKKTSGWKSFTSTWKVLRNSSKGQQEQPPQEKVQIQEESEGGQVKQTVDKVVYTSTMHGVVANGHMTDVQIPETVPEEPTPVS